MGPRLANPRNCHRCGASDLPVHITVVAFGPTACQSSQLSSLLCPRLAHLRNCRRFGAPDRVWAAGLPIHVTVVTVGPAACQFSQLSSRLRQQAKQQARQQAEENATQCVCVCYLHACFSVLAGQRSFLECFCMRVLRPALGPASQVYAPSQGSQSEVVESGARRVPPHAGGPPGGGQLRGFSRRARGWCSPPRQTPRRKGAPFRPL